MTRVRSMLLQANKQLIDEERKGSGNKWWFPMLLKERQKRHCIRTKTPPTSSSSHIIRKQQHTIIFYITITYNQSLNSTLRWKEYSVPRRNCHFASLSMSSHIRNEEQHNKALSLFLSLVSGIIQLTNACPYGVLTTVWDSHETVSSRMVQTIGFWCSFLLDVTMILYGRICLETLRENDWFFHD